MLYPLYCSVQSKNSSLKKYIALCIKETQLFIKRPDRRLNKLNYGPCLGLNYPESYEVYCRLVCKVTEPEKKLEISLIHSKNFTNMFLDSTSSIYITFFPNTSTSPSTSLFYDRFLFHLMMVSLRPLVLVLVGGICGPKGCGFLRFWSEIGYRKFGHFGLK